VKLNNIVTNSKAILHFIYNDIYIDNLEVDNVHCIGDIDNTSLILFNSGELHKQLSINNSIIKNSITNGSFIKILGDTNEIIINNTNINNIKAYGQIIENSSNKVNIKYYIILLKKKKEKKKKYIYNFKIILYIYI